MVEPTHLKNLSQIGSFPQVGMKTKNIWNHHPEIYLINVATLGPLDLTVSDILMLMGASKFLSSITTVQSMGVK